VTLSSIKINLNARLSQAREIQPWDGREQQDSFIVLDHFIDGLFVLGKTRCIQTPKKKLIEEVHESELISVRMKL
jgi:hypothetical protein